MHNHDRIGNFYFLIPMSSCLYKVYDIKLVPVSNYPEPIYEECFIMRAKARVYFSTISTY